MGHHVAHRDRPTRRPSESISGSFSTRAWRIMARATSRGVPASPTSRSRGVIASRTNSASAPSEIARGQHSDQVVPPVDDDQTAHPALANHRVGVTDGRVVGDSMRIVDDRSLGALDLRHLPRLRVDGEERWMMPMPPTRAMAIAMADSGHGVHVRRHQGTPAQLPGELCRGVHVTPRADPAAARDSMTSS